MCRLFALRANHPSRARGSLVSAPHALLRQSCGDRRGECHEDGWGIASFLNGELHRTRAPRAPAGDPSYRTLGEITIATTLLAHVRQASAGGVAERNCHPFQHGRWLFAHNGTLEGFAENPERLRRLIPAALREHIRGETDSEHAFYYLLGQLAEAARAEAPDAETVARTLAEVVARLVELFPGDASPSRLNFVLTDGHLLAATRWGHTLYRVERRGATGPEGDGPVENVPDYRAVVLASEPTSPDENWQEIPDRSVLRVSSDLECTITTIPH